MTLRQIIRAARLAYWRRARDNLTAKNPAHPDLPLILLRIADLEHQAARDA